VQVSPTSRGTLAKAVELGWYCHDGAETVMGKDGVSGGLTDPEGHTIGVIQAP
jgi:hypothetical protein